jgi:hypothetical protein
MDIRDNGDLTVVWYCTVVSGGLYNVYCLYWVWCKVSIAAAAAVSLIVKDYNKWLPEVEIHSFIKATK